MSTVADIIIGSIPQAVVRASMVEHVRVVVPMYARNAALQVMYDHGYSIRFTGPTPDIKPEFVLILGEREQS